MNTSPGSGSVLDVLENLERLFGTPCRCPFGSLCTSLVWWWHSSLLPSTSESLKFFLSQIVFLKCCVFSIYIFITNNFLIYDCVSEQWKMKMLVRCLWYPPSPYVNKRSVFRYSCFPGTFVMIVLCLFSRLSWFCIIIWFLLI